MRVFTMKRRMMTMTTMMIIKVEGMFEERWRWWSSSP
jgi:hypothetical protein